MTSTAVPTAASPPDSASVDLRVSAYERVASLLLASLLIVGCTVAALVVMWWPKREVTVIAPAAIQIVEEGSGRGDHAAGYARDMEEPGVEELAEVDTPQLSDMLAAVTTAVTLQPGSLDQLLGDSDAVGRGRGLGDSRGEGELGEGTGKVIPRWDRWEIRFSASQIDIYARQLDFFGIELGAMGGGKAGIEYASKLSLATPTRRSAGGEEESRLRFGWKAGKLQDFDRELLTKAGIDTDNRIVVQFASQALENELAKLESEHLAGRELSQVRKTVFGVQSEGNAYKLFVSRQDLRPRP